MQKKLLYMMSVAALISVSACSSTHTVHTKDGGTVVTDDKPELDKDTGLLEYKNAETGKKEQINKDEVKSMNNTND